MEMPPESQSSSSSQPPPPPPPPPSTKRARRHGKIRYRPSYNMDVPECEDIQKYVPGGFHPIDIGDTIAHYTVIHKLGSGGFATVWLVRSSEDGRYYALKILRADVPDKIYHEQQVMEYLGPHDHPSVIKLHHSFEITGPNGVHTCLVLPICGPSLYNWSLFKKFSHGARYRIAQQIASGIAFLHERGVAHADLTTSNVVFSLPDIQSLSSDAVYHLLGPVVKEKLKLYDGSYSSHGPNRVIKNPEFSGFNVQMTSAAVMIIDFGEAFLLDRPCHRTGLGITITSFPPEVCFKLPPSAGSDVWELACFIFEIFSGRPLFPLWFPVFEMLIRHIVHSVGLLPRSWQGHFDADKYGYIERGKLQSTPEGAHFWFEAKPEDGRGCLRDEFLQVSSESELTTEQQEFLATLLQEMMVREPERRLPARDVSSRIDSAASLFGGEVVEYPIQFAKYPDDAPPPPPPPSPPPQDSDDSDV